MRFQGPVYDLMEVQLLCSVGRLALTNHVTAWLINHEYDPAETAVEVITALESAGSYLGWCILVSEVRADEYEVEFDCQRWYVKFYIDRERAEVRVWSCWWQGTAH